MWEARPISVHGEKRGALTHDSANSSCGDAVTLQSSKSGFRRFGSDSDEQAAGSLRIEQQILIFGRDIRREAGTVTHKGAIVLEPGGEMTFARRLYRAGKIVKSSVIDFKRHGRAAVGWIAERHLARVTQQAEAGDIGDGVNIW